MSSPGRVVRAICLARAGELWHGGAAPALPWPALGSPAVPTRARSATRIGLPLAVGAAALLFAGVAGCSSGKAAAPTTTTTTLAPTPSQVLSGCTPAPGADFVAIERHLVHAAQHLGQGFVSPDGPDGHYLAADVYNVDNTLLATGLQWRIAADGSATAVDATTAAWAQLPVLPAGQAAAHPELIACVRAALATGS
jgi:hypothetical protein